MSLNGLAAEATATATNTAQPPSRNDNLAGLTKYIPIESMTLYIATVSAQKAISHVFNSDAVIVGKWTYWIFIALTPILMAIFFLRRIVLADQKAVGIPFKDYPWWKIVASTIAFSVWALAVPNAANPNNNGESAATYGVVFGLLALIVSTVLSLFEPFFEKQNSNP